MLRPLWFWLFAYVLFIAAIVAGFVIARQRVIAALSGPEARQEWDEWREEAARQTGADGNIQRRRPRSDEPPTLVLLRDHLPGTLAATLLLASVLYLFAAMLVQGVWRQRRAAGR